MSGEISNQLFETYKNSVIPHGNHMSKIASDMAVEIFYEYPSSKYALPHWKCVMNCCAKCPCIDIPSPESDQHNSNVSPTIRFYVYHPIKCRDVHGRSPSN